MPYGVDKDLGGDSPENDKWMEGCVARVKGTKGKDGKTIDEGSAIAICKETMRKHKQKKSSQSNIDPSIKITVEDF